MNIPKSYVPPAGATVNISTEGEGETTRDEDGIKMQISRTIFLLIPQ
jgi:hypothetical protein